MQFSLEEYQYWAGITMQESYMSPLINIISNLPKSLICLDFELPTYYPSESKIKKIESEKLVKALCRLLAEKDNNNYPSNALQSIILKNIDLAKTAKEYLLFIFGFNDKLLIKKEEGRPRKYQLSFI